MQGIFVTSNNTGSGKTTIAREICSKLKDKTSVKVRKPVESGCKLINNQLFPEDAASLAKSCDSKEALDVICPYRFADAVSPEKASNDSGFDLNLANLIQACRKNSENGFFVVEGAGGIYSPIAKNTLNVDLAKDLNLPLVLVINDELGAISESLLSICAAKKNKLKVLCLILNNIKDNKLLNYQELKRYTEVPIIRFSLKNTSAFWRDFEPVIDKLL